MNDRLKELTSVAWRPASDPPPMSEHCFEYYTSEPVLGYSPSGKIQVVTYKQLDLESPPEWFSNCSEEWNLGDTVTHWMPLPLLPFQRVRRKVTNRGKQFR